MKVEIERDSVMGGRMHIDPELQPALKMFPEVSFSLEALAEIRKVATEDALRDALSGGGSEGVKIRDVFIGGPEGAPDVRVRIYEPLDADRPLPGLLWIHGGGYVCGIPEQGDRRIREIVEEIGCIAVSVDYRLAPENPYPGPLEDCYAALKWMFDQAGELGLDSTRIAIGGGSAGGGLAAGLGLLARDRKELKICHQVLLYPMLDDRNTSRAGDLSRDALFWTRHNNHFGWKSYLGDEPGKDGVSAYAAPTRAVDLSGLPHTFIAVGDIDLLAGEDILFAHRLLQSGVPAELHVYPGAFHAFDVKVPEAGVSKSCGSAVLHSLKRAFSEHRKRKRKRDALTAV